MLVTAFSALYITALGWLTGRLTSHGATRLFHLERVQTSFVTTLLAGLAMLTGIATAVSLATALSLTVHVMIAATVIIASVASEYCARGSIFPGRPNLSRTDLVPLLIGAIACTLLITRTSRPADHYDVGLYHAQAIKWLHEMGTVAGLGNVHTPFAHNSGWHVLAAYFDLTDLIGAPVPGLNLVIIGAGWLTAMGGLRGLLLGRRALGDIVALLLSFPLTYFFVEEFASPITDTPAAVLGWIIFVLLLRRSEREAPLRADSEMLNIGMILAFWMTIKLSSAPAALILLAVFAASWRSPRRLVALSISLGVVVLPWMLRGVMLSGFIAFPLAAVPPLPVDWAMPVLEAMDQTRTVQSWAKIPYALAQDVASFTVQEWVPLWWARQNTLTRLLIPMALGSLPLTLAGVVMLGRVRTLPNTRMVAGLSGVWSIGCWFWFLGAPDPRYGLGFLIPIIALPAALVLAPIVHAQARATIALLAAAIVLMVAGALRTELPKLRWQERWLLPAPYIQTVTKPASMNGIPLRMPATGDQCWNSPLPCTPTPNAALEARGCALRDGFRMVVSGRTPIAQECRIIAPGGDIQADRLVISSLQVYRRNENEIRKIQCLVNRRNLIRVTLLNGSASASGPVHIQVQIDTQEPLNSTLASLESGSEQSAEIDIPGQIRPGFHAATAIVQYQSNGAEERLTQSIGFECVNP
jgi:hypothetical protein